MKNNNRYRFRVKVKYCNRLSHALKNVGLSEKSTISDIEQVLKNKITTQAEIDAFYHSVLKIIEPPYCQMSHCQHHTTYGFCGCGLNLIPSKCPIYKGYLQRQKVAEEKAREKCFEILSQSEKYKHLKSDAVYSMIDNTKEYKRTNYKTLLSQIKQGNY